MSDRGRPVVIRNVTLIDGTGAAPVPGQALIAEGRRISWIGPDGSLPEGAESGAIDGGGGTILPGLINCHVHLANDGTPDLFGQAARDSVSLISHPQPGHFNVVSVIVGFLSRNS